MECFYDWILIDTRLLLMLFLLIYDNQVMESKLITFMLATNANTVALHSFQIICLHDNRYLESRMYSSRRLNHDSVSLRPLGARSSHWYIPQSTSRPRA